MGHKWSRLVSLAVFSSALAAGCASGAPEAETETKATVCTTEYAPVCDAAGNIYSNTCNAIAAGATVVPTCHVVDLATPVATSHPYKNNQRLAWSLDAPAEAERMRIEFARFETETNFDVVRLFDTGTEIATYSGNRGKFVSAEVPGNHAGIVFNSDGSKTKYGFEVVRYAYFTPCACPAESAPVCSQDGVTFDNLCELECSGAALAYHVACEDAWHTLPKTIESAHPYANQYSNTWTVTEGGAKSIRLHFPRIDVEKGYDFVQILDANDALVTSYSGQLTDVYSPLVRGGTIKVKLVTDRTVTAWGFQVDSYQVQGGCYVGSDCGVNKGCEQVTCVRAPCFKVCVDCPSFTMPPPWYCDGGEIVPRDGANGCPMPPRCQRREGALCGGEHEFACDEGYLCVEGTCRAVPNCYVGGCNSELCTDDPGAMSTCVAHPWYACYGGATCAVQANGTCGWTETPELTQCIADHGGGPLHPRQEGEMCGGFANLQCDTGLECVSSSPGVPDAAGICRKKCGPILGGVCGTGFTCNITSGTETGSSCTLIGRTGVCLPTPEGCSVMYAPVCGCDGVTYDNDCRRLQTGIELFHQGVCAADNACEMPSECNALPPPYRCFGEWSCIEGQCLYHCGVSQYSGANLPQAIPDLGSVGSTVTAQSIGVVERVRVSLDVTHTYRGDLIVALSHGGTTAVLVAREGGSADGLVLSNVDVTGFLGLPGDGDWTLTVTDAARYDVGTLNSFTLDLN
jgi:hypothetical protein